MKPWQDLTDLFEDNQVIQEMQKKYKKTILGVIYNGKTSYASYQHYDQYHVFALPSGAKFQLANDTEATVFIPELSRGLYNTTNGAVLVTQVPRRQWRRGLTSDTHRIVTLKELIWGLGYEQNAFNEYVYEVLEQKYNHIPNVEQAMMFCNTHGSCALTKDFAIALDCVKEAGCNLYYHDCLVGDIDSNKITVRNNIFIQEILDTKQQWCPKHIITE